MTDKELKKRYGEEYPAAVIRNGVRMPLSRESRFSRHYDATDKSIGIIISRFMDGSASITLAELKRDWVSMTDYERGDYCQECDWLHDQPDFPEMVRFVMKNGGHEEWSAIALSIASSLPQDEAFDFLLAVLQSTKSGKGSNFAQAIAKTKHPRAESALRQHFHRVWSDESLWNDDEFTNWVAFDVTTCIAHLLEIGVSPGEFEEQARKLSGHVCSGNRNSCRNFLAKHYSWLQ